MPKEIVERCRVDAVAARRQARGAMLVAFLCSDGAGFISGAEIDIDGGGRLNTVALGSRKELGVGKT